jgi:hypothetical protein
MPTATRSAIPDPNAVFSPEKLINDLADPNMTLGDVAYLHDLTLEKLTLWIVRPDITERLKALTDSIYLRVRLTAINHLATTVNALNTMIGAYIDEERHAPVNPISIQDREQRRRARETARKAVALLTKLAHLPAQRRKAATPSPLGEGRGGVAEISKQEPAQPAPTSTPITPRTLHNRRALFHHRSVSSHPPHTTRPPGIPLRRLRRQPPGHPQPRAERSPSPPLSLRRKHLQQRPPHPTPIRYSPRPRRQLRPRVRYSLVPRP